MHPHATERRLPSAPLALLAVSALVATSANGQEPAVVRIMPLGDSITESFDGQASYRYFLWHQLVGRGYAVDFVGSMEGVFNGTPLYPDFDQDHEGHCGWTAADVLVEVGTWASSAEPDVVLVHLGTNDVAQGRTAEDIVADLGGIVDVIRGHNLQATVLLAQIAAASDPETEGLNAQIADLAAAKHTDESPVKVVDQWTGFSIIDDSYDGVHPNEQGEQKIAEAWYAALQAVLPTPPAVPDPGGCMPGGGSGALVALVLAALLRHFAWDRARHSTAGVP
jgi:lysophospholipase L1-like esterase